LIDLKTQYGDRYRITLDESASILGQSQEDRLWLYQIPGKFGHVYVHGNATLGAYVRTRHDPTDRLGRLLALPGARLHQRGDAEAAVIFAPECLDEVAQILRLRRRRQLTPEQRESARQRMKALINRALTTPETRPEVSG
jgi:hypothetical protein